MANPEYALVTGGTGFIGQHLVRRLASEGHRVRVLVRATSDRSSLAGLDGVELREGNILEPATLDGLADGIDWVFHLAAAGHVSAQSAAAQRRFEAINVEGLEHVMRVCRGARRFVHFSSTAAMGLIKKPRVSELDPPEPRTPYQRSKRASEERALALGRELALPTVVVRPCMVYGPGGRGEFEKMARWMRRGVFPRVGWGRNLTPLVHVRDVVQGAILAAERGHPGEVYLLTSARSPELAELRRWILEGWGTWAPYPYVPRAAMNAIALGFETYARLRGSTPLATRQNIASTVYDREFSIEKAREHLGYEPQVPFATGIRETIAWFLQTSR